MCSVTIKKTGKQVDLGCLNLFLHFAPYFMTGNFWGPFPSEIYLYCKAVLGKNQVIHGDNVQNSYI